MKIYEIKVKLGRYSEDKGFGVQFSITSHATGDKPYRLIINGILHGLLNKKLLEDAAYDIIAEIDGAPVPNEYKYTDKTVSEVFTASINDNIRDLGVDPILTDALTKAINEIIKERKKR